MKKDKLLRIIAWFTIISALALMGLFLLWSFYPYKLVEYKNLPYPVLNSNSTVKRGEQLIYEIDYCKHTNEIPEVSKFFIDDIIYQSPDSVAVATSGCRKQVIYLYVPQNLPTGKYSLRIIIRYHPNPIRTVTYINNTQTFTVE